jgi:hypothetical protein
MNIQKYRDIVVNTRCRCHVRFSQWQTKYLRVYDYIWPQNFGDENHPLVNKGEAYWTNDTTLVVGYFLFDNPNIFRTIFSHRRQDIIDEFQSCIPVIVHIRNKSRAFIALFKIKKLPRVIVEKIINLVY